MVVVCWSVCLSEVTKVNDPLNGLLNVYVSYCDRKKYMYSLSRLILAKHKEAIVSIKHMSTKNAVSNPLILSI